MRHGGLSSPARLALTRGTIVPRSPFLCLLISLYRGTLSRLQHQLRGVARDLCFEKGLAYADYFPLALRRGRRGDPVCLRTAVSADELQESIQRARKDAEAGKASGQFTYGWYLEQGKGLAKNEVEAAKWYRKAAEQNHPGAQNNLGMLYEHGRGVAKDEAEAAKWYRKAAEQGDANGQANLGYLYATGRGVEKSETEAVHWYRKAAEKGEPSALNNLGLMYETGRGVAPDARSGEMVHAGGGEGLRHQPAQPRADLRAGPRRRAEG